MSLFFHLDGVGFFFDSKHQSRGSNHTIMNLKKKDREDERRLVLHDDPLRVLLCLIDPPAPLLPQQQQQQQPRAVINSETWEQRFLPAGRDGCTHARSLARSRFSRRLHLSAFSASAASATAIAVQL